MGLPYSSYAQLQIRTILALSPLLLSVANETGRAGTSLTLGRAGKHRHHASEVRRPYRPCPQRALRIGRQRSSTDNHGRCSCPLSCSISPSGAGQGLPKLGGLPGLMVKELLLAFIRESSPREASSDCEFCFPDDSRLRDGWRTGRDSSQPLWKINRLFLRFSRFASHRSPFAEWRAAHSVQLCQVTKH